MLAIFLFLALAPASLANYWTLQTWPNRSTTVQLFEWKWTDVAKECETFLSKYGYGAVQVSPPNEHIFQTVKLDNGVWTQPWWVRYQPVSYKLESRSGTEAEFIDMVQRCNKVGVRIIADAVINHMTGKNFKYPFGDDNIRSWNGSAFDGTEGAESFPAVPYSSFDFNDDSCRGDIQPNDYGNNPWSVRQCRLVALLDLNQGKDWVRQKIADYLNRLIDIGVAGIRIDAAKHMWPQDLHAIIEMLKNLNPTIFGPNQRPFIVQEVIDKGGEAVKTADYLYIGRVTNFIYGADLAAGVRRLKNFKYFYNFAYGWNYWNSDSSMVFMDNHDNQRTDPNIITYREGDKYIMAVSYMLAWTYGIPRVMSGYYFDKSDQSPPTVGAPSWATKSPTFNPDETCNGESGWTCEHRWPAIRRMVAFRSVVQEEPILNVATGEHRIAFRRGSKGFFALNNNDGQWKQTFYTGLPPGVYCDIISGEVDKGNNNCTGATVTVQFNGQAAITIAAGKTLAIRVQQKIASESQPTTYPENYKRTVVMVQKRTSFGQDVFIRGGLDLKSRNCPVQGENLNSSKCAIPIIHRTQAAPTFRSYLNWKVNDKFLDFYAAEQDQGQYNSMKAEGTPLLWSTNDQAAIGYHPLNTYGSDYWLVDLMMDCSRTDNGWFVFKTILRNRDGAVASENDIRQASVCRGNDNRKRSSPQNIGNNHAGKCGSVNVYTFDSNDCEINT